jgi:hypothetical protein
MPLMLALAAASGLLFGSLLLVLTVGKALLALAAAVGAVTILWRPLLGLLLFAAVATSVPYTTVNLGIRITVSEALLGLTWVAVGARLLVGQAALHWGATEKAVALLLLFSVVPFVTGQLAVAADGSGLVNWVRWLLNVSPLFLVPLLLDTTGKRHALLVMLLLGNLLMLGVSIVMFVKDRDAQTMLPLLEQLQYAHPEAVLDIFSANYTRMGSPWVHPNLTGGALALFLPLALFYGIGYRGWRRALGYSTCVLAAAGLLFSISRGALVSLALVLLWMAYRRVPYVGKIIAVGTVLSTALVLGYAPLQERLATMFSAQNASTQVRADEYRKFPDAVAQYPLGIGFKVEPPVPQTDLLGISNLWLNYMYKLGALGMVLFIVCSATWWREVRPHGKVLAVNRDNALYLGTLGGLLAAFGTGLFDHYYSFTMVLVALFWLLLGMNLQQARALRPPPAPPRVAPGAPVLSIANYHASNQRGPA